MCVRVCACACACVYVRVFQIAHLERSGHYLTVKDNQVIRCTKVPACSNLLLVFFVFRLSSFIRALAWTTSQNGLCTMNLFLPPRTTSELVAISSPSGELANGGCITLLSNMKV